MSTRPNFPPQQVITSGDMSATSIASLPTILGALTKFSYAATWSGTSPVGTLALQVSNDYSLYADGSVKNSGTWSTVILNASGVPVSSIPVTGNTGSDFIDAESGAYAARIVYTKTSGVGTMNAFFTAKVG